MDASGCKEKRNDKNENATRMSATENVSETMVTQAGNRSTSITGRPEQVACAPPAYHGMRHVLVLGSRTADYGRSRPGHVAAKPPADAGAQAQAQSWRVTCPEKSIYSVRPIRSALIHTCLAIAACGQRLQSRRGMGGRTFGQPRKRDLAWQHADACCLLLCWSLM